MQQKPNQERVTVYLPSSIVAQVRALAASRRWSLSVACEEALLLGLPMLAPPKAAAPQRRAGRAA
jgi:hypothetical protein